MGRFEYLLLMAGCLACTLPLEFVYDAGVWRRPRRLAATLALPALVFTVWDVLAIRAGLWSFDRRWVTGWELPFRARAGLRRYWPRWRSSAAAAHMRPRRM